MKLAPLLLLAVILATATPAAFADGPDGATGDCSALREQIDSIRTVLHKCTHNHPENTDMMHTQCKQSVEVPMEKRLSSMEKIYGQNKCGDLPTDWK